MNSAVALARGPSWVHESPFLTEGWEDKNRFGPPSLKHSAMRQTLSDQRNLTPHLFATIPWRIANYLWDCLGKSRKRTFYMWKLFAATYPNEFRGITQYRSMTIEGPRMSLRDYLGLVKSDSLCWGVVITLANLPARVPELVDISSIENLMALEIITLPRNAAIPDEAEAPIASISDRIVRTWSELAQRSTAFSRLRALRFYHQEDLGPVALRYMKSFPSLRLVVVHECPRLLAVMKNGRTEFDGWEISTVPDEEDGSKPDTLYECYKANFMEGNGQGEHTTLSSDAPILDFQLGQIPTRHKHKAHRTLYLKRKNNTQLDSQEPVAKKQRLDPAPKKTKRPAMKDRKAKDLQCLLGDFL